MKSTPSFLLVMVVLSFVLAGCANTARLGGITVSIVDFRPSEASLLESRGTLTLRYTNENVVPIGFSGSRHKLELNGKYVGLAVSGQPFGIPPLSSITQDVTVNFENLALVRQLMAMRESRTAAYRIDSVLYQTIDDDEYEVRSRGEGSLDLRGMTEAAK